MSWCHYIYTKVQVCHISSRLELISSHFLNVLKYTSECMVIYDKYKVFQFRCYKLCLQGVLIAQQEFICSGLKLSTCNHFTQEWMHQHTDKCHVAGFLGCYFLDSVLISAHFCDRFQIAEIMYHQM